MNGTKMTDAVTVATRSLRHAGLDAIREFTWRTYFSIRSSTDADPILSADWDLLVVLDACRADLFSEVLSETERAYEGIQVGKTRVSPGSSSEEWLQNVFVDVADSNGLANIAYVSGNPYTARVLDADRFGTVVDVWRDAWDDDLGTIPPRPITDRAIELGREDEDRFDRMVVHYMQPHFPSLAAPDDRGVALSRFGDESMSVWEDLRFGRVSETTVWERYRANLEAVLEEVECLLANVDADSAVITADHGNAIGEYSIYGHPSGVDLPCLREVPWCETAATDRRTREPELDGSASAETATPTDEQRATVEEHLEQLGYRS